MTQNTWRDIATAPKGKDGEAPIFLQLCWFNVGEDGKPASRHVGEGYWQADTASWWWANTAPGDYYNDSIEESITGRVTHWAPLLDPPPL